MASPDSHAHPARRRRPSRRSGSVSFRRTSHSLDLSVDDSLGDSRYVSSRAQLGRYTDIARGNDRATYYSHSVRTGDRLLVKEWNLTGATALQLLSVQRRIEIMKSVRKLRFLHTYQGSWETKTSRVLVADFYLHGSLEDHVLGIRSTVLPYHHTNPHLPHPPHGRLSASTRGPTPRHSFHAGAGGSGSGPVTRHGTGLLRPSLGSTDRLDCLFQSMSMLTTTSTSEARTAHAGPRPEAAKHTTAAATTTRTSDREVRPGGGPVVSGLVPDGVRLVDDESRVVRAVLGPVATALAYLHAQNIIHRNVSPSTIYVAPSGYCVLCGLGTSSNMEEELPISRIGDAVYMAPEVATKPTPVQVFEMAVMRGVDEASMARYDEKADIWSLGAVVLDLCLYRMAHAPPRMAKGQGQGQGQDASPLPTPPTAPTAQRDGASAFVSCSPWRPTAGSALADIRRRDPTTQETTTTTSTTTSTTSGNSTSAGTSSHHPRVTHSGNPVLLTLVPYLRTLPNLFSTPFVDLLARMLHDDPRQRPTAREILEDAVLQHFRESYPEELALVARAARMDGQEGLSRLQFMRQSREVAMHITRKSVDASRSSSRDYRLRRRARSSSRETASSTGTDNTDGVKSGDSHGGEAEQKINAVTSLFDVYAGFGGQAREEGIAEEQGLEERDDAGGS